MFGKNAILRIIRRKIFQPFWGKLHHLSIIGQNYWSSTVGESGELHALDIASKELEGGGPFIVVDVGANKGQFALAAAERLKPARIYCFEPSRRTFHLLQEAINGNALLSIVDPQPYALSDTETWAVLYSPIMVQLLRHFTISTIHLLHLDPSSVSP